MENCPLGVQAAGVLCRGVVGLQIAGHLVHIGHSGADRRVSLGEGDRRVVAAGKLRSPANSSSIVYSRPIRIPALLP